jgi:DNA-binding transcriptional LysR family regulator
LRRDGKRIRPTEEGERLLSYARRILALAEEARDVVARPTGDGVIRLGLPEDFAAYRLAEMLSEFTRSRPGLGLYVRCGKSDRMRRALERGEIDLALFNRDAEETGGIAAWPERLRWITSRRRPVDFRRDPLPLAVFEQG